MQIHFDRPCFGQFGVPHLNISNPDDPFATFPVGPIELTILSEDEADQLIKRARQIKDMFVQHEAERATAAGDDAGRAIAADLDDDFVQDRHADLDPNADEADLDERGGSPSCQAARLGSGDCVHGHDHAGHAIDEDEDGGL